ncbi:MAG: ribosome recycling factor [Bdellovibrionota bacterium]|jgi:ribosome recycling factor
MTVVDDAELRAQFDEAIVHFKKELAKMRTSRANQSLIEDVQVNCYGTMVPLKQLGMISAPEARLLTVQAYDRNTVDSIIKAIHLADLGLNPANEGTLIRITVPALTEDRRKELVKTINKYAEDARISVRSQRQKANDVLKKQQKNKEISEDDLKRGQDEIQKITDEYIAEVDKLFAIKEKEMMEV